MTGRVALRGYQREWLRPDVIAGLTAAAVVIPKAMAYATIAGLPVQVGLYTALVPMVVYALLGTSRPLSVSTTTTIAILTGSALGSVAHGAGGDLLAAAATLAVMVGLVLLAARVLRLGFVANFISEPVLVGFKSGIGFVIVLEPVPKTTPPTPPRAFFATSRHPRAPAAALPRYARRLGGDRRAHLRAGASCRAYPRHSSPWQRPWGFRTARPAGARSGHRGSGADRAALGHVADLALVHALWPAAVSIALMSFTESIAAARGFAERDEPLREPNRELFALGVANATGGLLGAMPAGGGTHRRR